MKTKTYSVIGALVALTCSMLIAYPHRKAISRSLRVSTALRHRQAVTGGLQPYTIVLKEMTGYTDQDTRTTSITLARRSDGSEIEIQRNENRLNNHTNQNVTFSIGTIRFWGEGKTIRFRSDTATKQTYIYVPNSDSWKLKQVAQPDPTQGCTQTYRGQDVSTMNIQRAGNEDILGYETIKLTSDDTFGHLTMWRLPEASCAIVQQKMEFKSGGTDVKVPVSIKIGQDPDAALFDVSAYKETDPVTEYKAFKLFWTGNVPDGQTPSPARVRSAQSNYMKIGALYRR